MPRHPSPLPVAAPDGGYLLRTAERHRCGDCANYDACLTLAAAEDWPGMSCCACDGFAPRAPTVSAVALKGLSVPPSSTPLGRLYVMIHKQHPEGAEAGELADALGVTDRKIALLLEELVWLGWIRPGAGGRWLLSRRRPEQQTARRMAEGRACDPIVVQEFEGGALELVRGRLEVKAARLLGWQLIPAVVVAVPPCPVCGATLERYWNGDHDAQSRDGYCPGCEAFLWATPEGDFETVEFGPRRVPKRIVCAYCGQRPAYRRGPCRPCRSIRERSESIGVPKRRATATLRALRSGLGAVAIAGAVGLAYDIAVRVVELLNQEEREQLAFEGG